MPRATLFANAPFGEEGAVHVWRFACAQEVGSLADALSPDEVARSRRFVAAVHRERYVVQHAMMRMLLARYLDREPQQIVFGRGPRGKPHVVDSDLEVNLSHTDDLALLAVARRTAVGVDVERLANDLDPAELSRVLAPDERTQDRRSFFRIWCRKEAALKATGVGLIDDLASVSVAADIAIVEGTRVFVQDLAISSAHAAALATLAPCAALHEAETI